MFTFESQGNRIEEIRSYSKLTKKDFIKIINYKSETGYNNIIKGDRGVSQNVMKQLKLKYPYLDLNWLLTGEGTMFLDEAHVRNYDSDAIRQENRYLIAKVKMLESQVNLQNITIDQTNRLLRIVENLTDLDVESGRGYDNQDLRNRAAKLEIEVSELEKKKLSR